MVAVQGSTDSSIPCWSLGAAERLACWGKCCELCCWGTCPRAGGCFAHAGGSTWLTRCAVTAEGTRQTLLREGGARSSRCARPSRRCCRPAARTAATRRRPPPAHGFARAPLTPGASVWRKYEYEGHYPGLLLSLHQLCRQCVQSKVSRACKRSQQ